METKFQNSFIPKSSLETPTMQRPRQANFLNFIGMVVFLLSGVLGGGIYLWHQYLLSNQTSLQASLDKNKEAFEPQTIQNYSRLKSRFDSASSLLDNHVAFSAFFALLDKDTLKSVQFADFRYGQGTDGITIEMSGKAKTYNAVAYQSKVFSNEHIFKNVVFSNLDLDQSGNVVFKFTANLDPNFVLYKNNLTSYVENATSDTGDSSDQGNTAPQTQQANVTAASSSQSAPTTSVSQTDTGDNSGGSSGSNQL